jgi:hypothetical protein
MLLTSWEELLLSMLKDSSLPFDEVFACHLVVVHLHPVLYEEMGMRTLRDVGFFVDYRAYGAFLNIPADVLEREVDALAWVRKVELCIDKEHAVYMLTAGSWRQLADTDVSTRLDGDNPDYNTLCVRHDAIAKIGYVVSKLFSG